MSDAAGKDLLDALGVIIKTIGKAPKALDIAVAEALPKETFGGFADFICARTISSRAGEEQLLMLEEALASGKWDGKTKDMFYPWILPADHPLGQFCMTIAEGAQPLHGLKSISWNKKNEKGVTLQEHIEKKYPNARQHVKDYIKIQKR